MPAGTSTSTTGSSRSSNSILRPPSNSWPCSWPLPAITTVSPGRAAARAALATEEARRAEQAAAEEAERQAEALHRPLEGSPGEPLAQGGHFGLKGFLVDLPPGVALP